MVRSYHTAAANGVRIWEWRGEMMHAKTSVVDGRWVRVGSTDFNPLGMTINFELDAVIEDAALGADAEAMFLDDLTHSRELWLRRGGKVGPRDGTTGEGPSFLGSTSLGVRNVAAEGLSRAVDRTTDPVARRPDAGGADSGRG